MAIEQVLGRPDFRIPCDRLIRANGSIVYAWCRQGRVLYIGMSGTGLLRPLNSHDVTWAFRPGDTLLWSVETKAEARRRQRRATEAIEPDLNGWTAERPVSGDPLVGEWTPEADRGPHNLELFAEYR